MNRKQIDILGVRVDKITKNEVVSRVSSLLDAKKQFFIATPNPEIVLAAHRSSELRKIINGADISVADGVGLKLADFSLHITKGRVLFLDLLGLANEKKLRVYLLGSTQDVVDRLKMIVQRNYPNIDVMVNNGMKINELGEVISESDKALEDKVLEEINKFCPDLVFVAFGAPKQEFWVSKHLSNLNKCGVMVVGGTFDYIVSKNKVPQLVAGLGIEWLWRVAREPRRIGRIVNAVVVFPIMFTLNKLHVLD